MNRNPHAGMSLVELIIALLLGTLVVAAAIGMFVANRQTMTYTQGLGRMQQNLRVALDLIARDLRRAGSNPCSRHIRLTNVIATPAARWWTDLPPTSTANNAWIGPAMLRGLGPAEFSGGSQNGQRVAGSDAIQVLAADNPVTTVSSHDGTRFILNTTAHGFSSGNILLVCDHRQASLFQAVVSGRSVTHPAGGAPGNCSPYLGFPGGCNAEPFSYGTHALIARLAAVRWYLGHNGRGGTSLYRVEVSGNGQSLAREEMIEDASTLNFWYLLAGNEKALSHANVAGRWGEVTAVRVAMSVNTPDHLDDAGEPLTRSASVTVAIRNRNP